MILSDITMKEFRAGLRKTRTLILPYGTVEAHGDHLPLSTDTLAIWRACIEAAKKRAVFVAPPLHYGVCTSTGSHPGTLGITPATLRRLTVDLVRDASARGLKNFILISGHGGRLHAAAMREAGEKCVREIKGIRLAALTVYETLGESAARIAETEGDSHAGEIETSLVMHLEPSLVKGRGKKGRPALPKPFITREKTRYWPSAVDGDPTRATARKGELFFAEIVKGVVGIIDGIEKGY